MDLLWTFLEIPVMTIQSYSNRAIMTGSAVFRLGMLVNKHLMNGLESE